MYDVDIHLFISVAVNRKKTGNWNHQQRQLRKIESILFNCIILFQIYLNIITILLNNKNCLCRVEKCTAATETILLSGFHSVKVQCLEFLFFVQLIACIEANHHFRYSISSSLEHAIRICIVWLFSSLFLYV